MNISIDGTQIFVGSGGVPWEADRRTLLLMHGAGMNRTVWVLLARYYARHGYNVVVPDLPGHGASGGDPLTSIESSANFIWSLIDALQSETDLPDSALTLGGHSMGALIVTEAVLQQPSRVEQLILFGSGYPMSVGAPLLDAAKADEQSAVDMIAIYAHSLSSQIGHNSVAGISVMNNAMALLEQARPGVLFADLNACNNYKGLDDSSRLINLPACTIISGRDDKMTPFKAANNLAALLEAEFVPLDNCGHMMMGEQPEETLQAASKVLL